MRVSIEVSTGSDRVSIDVKNQDCKDLDPVAIAPGTDSMTSGRARIDDGDAFLKLEQAGLFLRNL